MPASAFRFNRATLEKPIRFGLYGGLGCLVAALLLGELALYVLMPDKQEAQAKQPPPPPMVQVDIFFVLDVTASMEDAIEGVRVGIVSFAGGLDKQGLDPRIGLLAFRDLKIGKREEILRFDKGEPFTRDYKGFSGRVGHLEATGGGDIPESSLDALATAAAQSFRPDAVKVIILITDAPPHSPDEEGRTAEDIGIILKQHGIDQLHLVVNQRDRKSFEPVQKAIGGEHFPLSDAERGKTDYNSILPQISKQITEAAKDKQPAAKSLQSTQEYAPKSTARLLVAIAFWTALLAAGIALALIVGQNHYLKRNLLSQQEGVRGGLGAAACGLVAGFVGQALFQFADTESTFLIGLLRLVGWALLGALLGLGMSFFVKNLRIDLAAAGGAVGGLIGAIFFMFASWLFGDVLGRLLGAFLLGFGIGMMVALVEMAFRKAWLEVRYGPREMISVNLGPEPVKVGGDGKACTIWARGAAAVAYRFWIREGKVICEDVAGGGTREIGHGTRYNVGSVEVIVRTGHGDEPAKDPLPAAQPPEVPPAKPVALPSNPRELRAPVPPTPVVDKKPVVVTPPIVTPPSPAKVVAPAKSESPPATSPPPPPPPPPAPTPAAKPPVAPKPAASGDACPGCGRKVPGLIGQRYCMVCDHTF